jgi:hypothetical protein
LRGAQSVAELASELDKLFANPAFIEAMQAERLRVNYEMLFNLDAIRAAARNRRGS